MKDTILLVIVLIVGLIFGSIMGKILGQWVPFLGVGEQITWQPKGDFVIFKYDFLLQVKLNLSGILGLVLAYWLYKKMK
jgi:hypothetical protein